MLPCLLHVGVEMWNRKTATSLIHNGIELNVILSYSKRKTIALYVYRDSRIELRAPNRCPASQIDAFLHARRDWILRKQAQLQALPAPVIYQYCDGELHSYLGRDFRLVLLRGRPLMVEKLGDSICIRLPDPGDPRSVSKALGSWYRKMALIEFPERLDHCYRSMQHLGIPMPDLKVRKMKARWGSCSSASEICLNSVLIQKPTRLIDYVITHELCHLLEFSHNKAFQALMTSVMPDWKQREVLLNDGLESYNEPSSL
jgi:predicted metal-dependent hydrolase